MMPHAFQANLRPVLECWAIQLFRNEGLNTVRDHDLGTLPEMTIQRIEDGVLADAHALVSELPTARLQDRHHMNCMISESISEVTDRLRKAAARQNSSSGRRN